MYLHAVISYKRVDIFYFGYLRVKLNKDQSQIVNFALQGHNLLITGQAGIGKSEVIKAFIGNERGRKGNRCHMFQRHCFGAL